MFSFDCSNVYNINNNTYKEEQDIHIKMWNYDCHTAKPPYIDNCSLLHITHCNLKLTVRNPQIKKHDDISKYILLS